MKPSLRSALLAAAFAGPAASHAVTLNPDGLGQALIYPYYTVQSDSGNLWNTFVTVVNHSSDAKALRVRFREGRNARPTASFNVFLAPRDTWAAAVVATFTGANPAALVTRDSSCTSPQIPLEGLDFNNNFYSGAFSDGFGDGVERSREGFVEVIEMATLTGASAAAVTNSTGNAPANCALVQGGGALDVAPPTGGLSGTLTLVNVHTGMDFNSNAEALAELTTQPFYRPVTDPYPDFNAVEIQPVSTVIANGNVYRSVWSRPVDAVSSVLMRAAVTGEFVLDRDTRSRSDFVVTFPTRAFYVQGNSYSAPFEWPAFGGVSEQFKALTTDRNTVRSITECETGISPFPPCRLDWAWAANVFAIDNRPDFSAGPITVSLLGSRNGWTAGGFTNFRIPSQFQNGSITFRVSPVPSTAYRNLVSQPSSTRMNIATGQVTSGAHTFRGLPLMGMTLRTFENGTLTCAAGACQGNYGGSFPATYERNITP